MIKNYIIAKDIIEADKLLKETKGRVIAGGTWIRFAPYIETVIDITRTGLDYINKNGVYKIGATTVIENIVESELLKKIAGGVLNKHAGFFYPFTLRNLATVGGNIVPYFPLSDLAPVFLSLDAVVETTKKTYSFYEFIKLSRRSIGKEEILTSITIPEYTENFISSSFRFSQLKNEFAWITGIVNIITENSVVKDSRIVISACTRRPTRLKTLEEKLKGNKITDGFLSEVRKHVGELKLILDRRSSIEYRKIVIENLLVNSFLELKKYAG